MDYTLPHDGIGHYPLGAGSYYFRDDLIGWIRTHIAETQINIFIGAQPNSSPHIGNITNIATAFALGQHLQRAGKIVCVYFDSVDTAPAPELDSNLQINGVLYQRSLRWRGVDKTYLCQFNEILKAFSRVSGVAYTVRMQADILSSSTALENLREIISQHCQLGALFSPKNGCIGARAACPNHAWGLADKAGIRNRYLEDCIEFHCPTHGNFALSLRDPQQTAKLELNTPMRNLLRNQLFCSDPAAHWIQVIGADYAGFYQEQLLWRPLATTSAGKPPIILYSPAILDWSGAKLSKSLYVERDAYKYLSNTHLRYMLSYDLLAASEFTLEIVYHVCSDWIDQPHKLFRAYSIYYLHDLLTAAKDATSS
ncbi:hypothetical protein RJZ56_007569 [Blastomyces dermatitidis]|uniref:Uncharacterized protein n=1 Tax=Ajellomyces dermatitidis (strain ATCC 18188 / CBS 674.68) TaxID=653446 RepID=F2TTG2_AJEDA|nr:hypothetical protein BDDG_09470 [Blastomyces dermatitidis ATCC 18188]EQL36007.1 hypothetical protein BDFG_02281 [Blastomyces dermatitidis ATCC 26199]KMW69055.1 hypothetical protein, variant [Blastomyces dermatitidis ATCC 18188]